MDPAPADTDEPPGASRCASFTAPATSARRPTRVPAPGPSSSLPDLVCLPRGSDTHLVLAFLSRFRGVFGAVFGVLLCSFEGRGVFCRGEMRDSVDSR